MAAVKNIIFDLGGVLLNLDTGLTRKAFIELGVVNFDELFRIGYASSFFKDYEAGAITDEGFINSSLQLMPPGTSKEQVINAWNKMLLDFPEERVELLNNLKKTHRLFLFSNTNAIHLEAFQKSYFDAYGRSMEDHFEKAWYSHIINRRKPDVAAFEYVLRDSGLEAGNTLFIDDALVNVEGARAAGMQAIHLEPGKTIVDLRFN